MPRMPSQKARWPRSIRTPATMARIANSPTAVERGVSSAWAAWMWSEAGSGRLVSTNHTSTPVRPALIAVKPRNPGVGVGGLPQQHHEREHAQAHAQQQHPADIGQALRDRLCIHRPECKGPDGPARGTFATERIGLVRAARHATQGIVVRGSSERERPRCNRW